MSRLYDYFGMKINLLCLAVKNLNEREVDRLLADENFNEINEGVSPLYFIGSLTDKNLDNDTREKVFRIFKKILNNSRFTNVNTVFYDGHYSETLLYKLLYLDDPIFEKCCVELINSPKYQLIDYPGNYGDNPNDLNTAIIREKKLAAKAIMDHPDFTKIDFCFGGPSFVDKCKELYNNSYDELNEEVREALQLIFDEYLLRRSYQCYNATDTNIAERLTNAIETLTPYVSIDDTFPPISAACSPSRSNNMVLEIINHPKFTSEMLSRHIEEIARQLTDKEAYDTFINNKKIEGWTKERYGKLAYFSINRGRLGLLKALLENDNIILSEQFYSYYTYFLKNAIKVSGRRNFVLDSHGYGAYIADEICRIVEEKYEKQMAREELDNSKFVELTGIDYYILRNGMDEFYDLLNKNGNESFVQNELDNNLKSILKYDRENDKIGPFFNIFDRDKVWKFFSKYESFDEYRNLVSTNIKSN